MSIQVTTGFSRLVGLGVSAGDVATLITLGNRVGNWYTAASGDEEFLAMLDEDELEILHRGGLLDLPRFNKRWSKQMRLLVNGKAQVYKGEGAKNTLGTLTRFTAVMVCLVAALDAFTSLSASQTIMKNLMKELLRATEHGEDLMVSRLANRINAWRSAACVRGLSIKARKIRDKLLSEELIQDGYMPFGEWREVLEFLYWLLAERSEKRTTNSSDVAGMAVCLSELGLDILSVEGFGTHSVQTSCTLEYSAKSFLHLKDLQDPERFQMLAWREQSTSVSLISPEESFSKFPIKPAVANRCRKAWSAGKVASKSISIVVETPRKGTNPQDLEYRFVDHGTELVRTDTEIAALVDSNAPLSNQEVCDGLALSLQRESSSTLAWLLEQTLEARHKQTDYHNDTSFSDPVKVEAYTVFQAFFTGFYYTLFLELVDTSSLAIQSVNGIWGYRSSDILMNFRYLLGALRRQGELRLRRVDIIFMLSKMLLSHSILETSEHRYRGQYLGVVAKRALVTNSLVNACLLPTDIGRFVLLDVDVGGIPTNNLGLIRPGVEAFEGLANVKYVSDSEKDKVVDVSSIRQLTPSIDMSLHIEPDWSGDPETTLLCVRYKGRRLTAIDPAATDVRFCMAHIEPVKEPLKEQPPQKVISTDIHDLLTGDLVVSGTPPIPVVVQAYGKPFMRYATVGLYHCAMTPVMLASNCIYTAVNQARAHAEELSKNTRMPAQAVVVIAGHG